MMTLYFRTAERRLIEEVDGGVMELRAYFL